MADRVTLRDVAKHAGVSRTTASNVVTGVGRVSGATRDRVRQSMKDLGYVYSQAAGVLRRQTSRTVGIVVTNIDRPHFGEILIGLESTLSEAGYTPFVVSTRDRLDRQEQALLTLREHQVAALAVVPATGSDAGLVTSLADWGVPAIFVARYVRDQHVAYVGPDDVEGGRLAGQHLVDHGCRTLVYVGGHERVNSRIDRIAGVRRAIADANGDIALRDMTGDPTGEGGLELGLKLLREPTLPDGVVCHGDLTAMGLMRALHDAGRDGEVRVVGYDDIAATRYFIPALTSVASSGTAMGAQAAKHILEALANGGPVASSLQTPRLMVRESCGPHAGDA